MIGCFVPRASRWAEGCSKLVTPKLDTVRVGFIGLGMGTVRSGDSLHIPGTKVVALCDIRPEQSGEMSEF